MPDQTPAIRLSPDDANKPWAKDLIEASSFALEETERELGLSLDQPPSVEVLHPEEAFFERLGQRPHNIVAVALPHQNKIIINLRRFAEGGGRERHTTLVHEFSHLIVGQKIPAGLPRWMDEGLAMIASRETSFTYPTRVAIAATFGSLIPLRELQGAEFGIRDQELAYAQSLSATRFFLETYHPTGRGDTDDPAWLVQKLADPEEGEHLRALVNDPNFIRGFERQWRDSLRSFWTWIAGLSTAGLLWVMMTFLFLLAYWRKRRMARATEQQWKEDEENFPYLE